MKRLSFTLMITLLAGLLGFQACNTEDVEGNLPLISFPDLPADNTISLPKDGGTYELQMECTRDWQVTLQTADVDWIFAEPASGNGSATISFIYAPNLDVRQTAIFRIATTTTYVDVTFVQEGSLESELILKTDFSTGAPSTSGSTFPAVNDWPTSSLNPNPSNPWNLSGEGITGVTITGTNASVRANSASNNTGASGSNNIMLAAAGTGNFVINNIQTLGLTYFQLSFGFAWSAAGSDNPAEPTPGKVEYSVDGTTWNAIDVTLPYTPDGASTTAWNLVSCSFNIPDGSQSLWLRFAASKNTYGGRIDDVTLNGAGTPVVADVTVTTGTAGSIAKTSATISGNAYVINEPSATVTEYGVAYALVGGAFTEITSTEAATSFSANLTGLTANTTYQFKAYAKADGTTYYGTTKSFTTLEDYVPPVAVTTFADDFQSITTTNVLYENAGKGWRFESTDSDVANGWKTGIYNTTDKYLQCAPYGSSQSVVTCYAIMPPVNVNAASSKKIGYTRAYYYLADATNDGTKLEIVASTDFAGNAATATWTVVKDLTFTFGTDAMNTWVAGEADLASTSFATSTSCVIAFRYTGKAITYRLDDVTFNSSSAQVFSMDAPELNVTTLKQGAAAAANITIDYRNATGSESFAGVTVTPSGAGAPGLNVSVPNPLTTGAAGSGTFTFNVTGTPTASGAVLFTIANLAGLPSTTVSGNVTAAGAADEFSLTWDFSGITTATWANDNNPCSTAPTTTGSAVLVTNLTATGFGGAAPTTGVAAKSWGGNGFDTNTEANAASSNIYATVVVKGTKALSFNNISGNIRHSAQGPTKTVLFYKIGSGSYVQGPTIDNGSGTAAAGNAFAAGLGSISDLQGVVAGTEVTFKLVPAVAIGSGGTWYLNGAGSPTTSLVISGTEQ